MPKSRINIKLKSCEFEVVPSIISSRQFITQNGKRSALDLISLLPLDLIKTQNFFHMEPKFQAQQYYTVV